jgi:hypothetical protein
VKRAACVLVLLALGAAACNNNSSSSSTPTTPTVPTTTDTLSGTVQVKGSDFKPFTVTTAGEVDVTLTAAGPPATIVMGLGIGTTGTGACVLIPNSSALTAAGSSAQVSGIMSPGTYCVLVYDVGNQTDAVSWTATVHHP